MEMMIWEQIKGLLPGDWEAACEECGGITRKRQIETPEELLELNLYYIEEGGSYNRASLMMREMAGIAIGKTAVANRIRKSGKWLQRLGQGVCEKNGIITEEPEFLQGRKVIITDASDMTLPGSKTSEYRLHYALDLFGFTCRYMKISSIKEGERFGNYPIKEGEIVIGDRGYGTVSGMEYVRGQKADYIVRMRSKAYILYDERGERIDPNAWLRGLTGTEPGSLWAYYKTGKEYKAVRVVAQRKDEEAESKSRQRIQKTERRKGQKRSKEAIEYNDYIVVATSIKEYSEEQILELYRARWQIELVFRRMKSLLKIEEIPVSRGDSVKAWFYGKLLSASLCEAMMRRDFSPGGKSRTESSEPLESIRDSLSLEG